MDRSRNFGDAKRVLRDAAPSDGRDSESPVVAPFASTVDRSDGLGFVVPVIELDPAVRESERILLPRAASAAGGAYKMLRTQVLRRLDEIGSNTLMLLSPTAGAGKTLTAINLAVAIAGDPDRSALLIDFDLRNPRVSRRFGVELQIGVEDCIESGRRVQEAMFKINDYDRLTVVGARRGIEHSSELLAGQRTADLVAEMRSHYADHLLIFDMAPVMQADDAIAFARNVQAGLLVVGEGHTRREEVTRTLELMRELTIVGTVLNDSRDHSEKYY